MIDTWDDMTFWRSGEWQVVEEHLNDLDIAGVTYNPNREDLFRALDETPFNKVKVMFIGQDPYPCHEHSMGLAFSVPKHIKVLPDTLKIILDEYENDLHYERPMTGDLHDWAHEGVLLWNSVPSCLSDHSLSHDWPEWKLLTEEIIFNLREKGVVFVFVGSHARKFHKHVKDWNNCRCFHTDHPSPRSLMSGRNPFKGSRIFSSVNALLGEIGIEPVDWKLPCKPKRTTSLRGKRRQRNGLHSATVRV